MPAMQDQPKNVTVSLVGQHSATLYGTFTFFGVAGGWGKYSAELVSTATGEHWLRCAVAAVLATRCIEGTATKS
jgi:hypothetical protein